MRKLLPPSRPEQLVRLGSREIHPENWPPMKFEVPRKRAIRKDADKLARLIKENSSETEIDRFLKQFPEFLYLVLGTTSVGHHGTWVIPQQEIRPKTGSTAGLIPDYIVGGAGSSGFQWWIVELKGADAKLFTKRRNKFTLSNTLNCGICQLLEYLNYCEENQAFFRDSMALKQFKTPKGMLIIGREDELDTSPDAQNLKRYLNVALDGCIEIRTYDSLIRHLDDLRDFEIRHNNRKNFR